MYIVVVHAVCRACNRWKRPVVAELASARAVTIRAFDARLSASVREEISGGGGKRAGWRGADGDLLGVEAYVLEHYLSAAAASCPIAGSSSSSTTTSSSSSSSAAPASSSASSSCSSSAASSSSSSSSPSPPVWSRGVHLENGLFLSLFALLLWDPLFAPHPAAFASRCQDAPDDLLDGGGLFYARRATLIETALNAIANGEAPARLAAACAAHRGVEAVGVHWGSLDLPLLQATAEALGGAVVEAICRALALDYPGASHGAPDLLLLTAPPAPPRARFVEVKGPNDSLRDAQLAWIDVLVRAGADVEVAYVQSAG